VQTLKYFSDSIFQECGSQMITSPIFRLQEHVEFGTPERCFIVETLGIPEMSVARARVEPGVTTAWHAVEGTVERYIMAEGRGRVWVGELPPEEVGPGDLVTIEAGVRQRNMNVGDRDLIFYCVCTPRFEQKNYRTLE
jgi:mannose-6-phosphate isomerase-like protein (cupin superfamily)